MLNQIKDAKFILRSICLLLSLQFIQACSMGGGPAPADHFYRLAEITLQPQASASFNRILIKSVKSSGLYHERAILFIESDKPLELQRYHYNFWASSPAEIIHDGVFQGLLSSGIGKNVSRILSLETADIVLDIRIINFQQLIKGSNISVDVELEITVSKASKSWSKRYQVNQPAQSSSMHASVEAFSESLKSIINQLVEDLLSKDRKSRLNHS